MAIERLHSLSLRRRHPRVEAFSRYLDGDLTVTERRALVDHVHSCARCRAALDSLERTIHGLGSLEPDSSPGVADSIIAALRTEDQRELASLNPAENASATPALRVVSQPAVPPARSRRLARWPQDARAALRWTLAKRQLRLTLPITVVAGTVLSTVNMGGMLLHGRIDLSVCVSCTIDFLVPFLALNIGLWALVRLPDLGRQLKS